MSYHTYYFKSCFENFSIGFGGHSFPSHINIVYSFHYCEIFCCRDISYLFHFPIEEHFCFLQTSLLKQCCSEHACTFPFGQYMCENLWASFEEMSLRQSQTMGIYSFLVLKMKIILCGYWKREVLRKLWILLPFFFFLKVIYISSHVMSKRYYTNSSIVVILGEWSSKVQRSLLLFQYFLSVFYTIYRFL